MLYLVVFIGVSIWFLFVVDIDYILNGNDEELDNRIGSDFVRFMMISQYVKVQLLMFVFFGYGIDDVYVDVELGC